MRVRLKGINSKRKRLADGRVVTYWYAWKGGPRLFGSPGSPEFIAAYNEAVKQRSATPAGILLSIMRAYQNSGEFLNLAPRTRADYVKQIIKIEREFGDFPLPLFPIGGRAASSSHGAIGWRSTQAQSSSSTWRASRGPRTGSGPHGVRLARRPESRA
jgi:hypothetical protein